MFNSFVDHSEMKVLALILAALVVYGQAIQNDSVLQLWNQFQIDYGKTYRSPIEARARFNIFKDNLKSIEEHNSLFEKGQVTFKKGINRFSDWTHEEFRQYLNKNLINKPKTAGQFFKKGSNFVAPASVDWRTKNVVTDVKDEGECSSCWAFSTTGAIEGQLGLQGKLVSLSEQLLIDCSRRQGNSGCVGGLMTAAFDYVKESGIESESDYPYLAQDSDCKANASKLVTKITNYVNIPQGDENALVEALTNKGPIAVAIDAAGMHLYSSGIFDDQYCSAYSLNLGVLAVGYGSENGVDYYIIKNSWGEDWGEQGYVRLLKKGNKCGIATMASYPVL